jgi:hypothetical protein
LKAEGLEGSILRPMFSDENRMKNGIDTAGIAMLFIVCSKVLAMKGK